MLETISAWFWFLSPILVPTILIGGMWRAWSRRQEFKLSSNEKIVRLAIIFAAVLLLAYLISDFVTTASLPSWGYRD
jgi:hypothetical protein